MHRDIRIGQKRGAPYSALAQVDTVRVVFRAFSSSEPRSEHGGKCLALEAGTADWVSALKHGAVAAASIQGSLTTASKSVGLAIVAGRLI
jgi:hypothetical protein